MTICVIKNCNNLVARETTNNHKRSNIYCTNHMLNGVEVKCDDCGKILLKSIAKYSLIIKNKLPILCKKCSSSKNMIKALIVSQEVYIGSEKQKEHLRKIGSKAREIGQKVLQEKYYGTECHKQQYIKAFGEWNGSEANLKQLKKLSQTKEGKERWKIISEKGREIAHKNIDCIIHGHQEYSIDKGNGPRCIKCMIEENFKMNDFISYIKEKLNIDGKIIPTFRISDEKYIGKAIFEKYLIKIKINWFVYAKITLEGIISVIGKSGSLNVNKIGSDLCFKNNSLTSKLIIQANLHQNKDFIIIWDNPNWNEKDSLNYETKIGDALLKQFSIINMYSHRI